MWLHQLPARAGFPEEPGLPPLGQFIVCILQRWNPRANGLIGGSSRLPARRPTLGKLGLNSRSRFTFRGAHRSRGRGCRRLLRSTPLVLCDHSMK